MDSKRTQISQDGIDFVVLFASTFMNVHVSGYKALLMEPPETTGGGKQATQHIVLKPQLDGDPLLTVGHVNVATRAALLRDYDCMRALHKKRFGERPFHVAQKHYQSFFDSAQRFLKARGMEVVIETAPPELEPPAARAGPEPRSAPSRSLPTWLVLVLAALIGGGVAYLIASGKLPI